MCIQKYDGTGWDMLLDKDEGEVKRGLNILKWSYESSAKASEGLI